MLRSPVIQELKISSWSNIILAYNCKCELLMWKANNNTHGKYCTQTIPVSFYILGILIRLLKAQKQIIRHVNSH